MRQSKLAFKLLARQALANLVCSVNITPPHQTPPPPRSPLKTPVSLLWLAMKCSKAYFRELSLLHSTHGLIFISDVSVRRGFFANLSVRIYYLKKKERSPLGLKMIQKRKSLLKLALHSTLRGMRFLRWRKVCGYVLMARHSCLQHHLPVWACPKCDRQARSCQSVTFLALACAACVDSDISAKTHDSLKNGTCRFCCLYSVCSRT